jgi:predicted Zn-dependent protease
LIAQEAPVETAAHFESLRRRQPDNVEVLYTLASVRRSLGELEQSQRLLDELLTAQPKHVAGLIERGKVAMDLGRLEEAETWLRQALDREPKHADAHLSMSRCLLRAGRETEAKRFRESFEQIEAAQKRARAELAQKLSAGSP